MAAISPSQIVDSILDAIHQSGETGAYVSSTPRTHPRKFQISHQGSKHSLWVYIWTLTHGGRPSLPDEFRIQMTSVSSPLDINPNGLTVLLGYFPSLKMFAGFDLNKHREFTTGSPSVQIDLSAIHDALQNGLSFFVKSNDEVAIGVSPEQLAYYCVNAQSLHEHGSDTGIKDLLVKASESGDVTADVELLAEERKRLVSTVSRLSRDSGFKRRVKNAYDNRCAVTRAQLRLIDAAHILPVPSEESSDLVTNGISLSPTYHRAYDNCLIYLDTDLKMQLNPQKAQALVDSNIGDGLPELEALLNQRIHLPLDSNQRPNVEYIRLANKYRRIPGY